MERMDQNEEMFVSYMNDAPFQKVVTNWIASEAYRRLRSDTHEEGGVSESEGERTSVPGDLPS
jgi:type I restriction enzyme R subunit